jgi:Uma2 family endonuclease
MLAFASAVLPALLSVSRERLAQVFLNAAGEPDGKLHAAPDLVVAVLSPGPQHQQRDRETQLKRYSRRGVCASWLVDRGRRQGAVYRRRAAARLELAQTLGEGDPLTSPLLPGVARPGGQSFLRPAFFAR